MDDLISRKALCDYALNQKDKSVTPNDIMRFPSAQPMRKKGKWERHGKGLDGYWECTNCQYASDMFDARQYNYCPNCGAYMREWGEE